MENHPMCGITTGGQEECYFDCTEHQGVVKEGFLWQPDDLNCLLDCFSQDRGGETYCLTSLLRDLLAQGSCPPHFYYSSCTSYGRRCTCDNDRSGSLCSARTLQYLKTDSCAKGMKILPRFLLELMLGNRNGPGLIGKTCGIGNGTFESYYEWQEANRVMLRSGRLNPAWESNLAEGFRTRSEYSNTLHRYPWICSLRQRGGTHLCAVTLLGAPPGPTVIVSSAHCTFLCQGPGRQALPPCCCRAPEYGPSSCSEDSAQCGARPGVVKMEPQDAEILCGEWDTGEGEGKESYNVLLNITQIVRHPSFVPALGPIAGSDIAVFKVDDSNLWRMALAPIFPVCVQPLCVSPAWLPGEDPSPPSSLEGFPNVDTSMETFHSGWSNPPPISYLEKYGAGFLEPEIYRDFSKQWHRKMDLFNTCHDDPYNNTGPSSFYPAASLCARDFTERSCFSPGDSGSPLMQKDPADGRYSVLGLQSFVKGCDWFRITNNKPKVWILEARNFKPPVFTRLSCFLPWVASEYGLSYAGGTPHPTCSQQVGNRMPGKCLSGCLGDQPCIFPFYYNGRLYKECILLEMADFVHRVRCPTRNVTSKIDGINSFTSEDGNRGLCGYYEDPQKTLDPAKDCPLEERGFVLEQCRLTCPGGNLLSHCSLVFIPPLQLTQMALELLEGAPQPSSNLPLWVLATSCLAWSALVWVAA